MSPLGVTALALLPDGHTMLAGADSGLLTAWSIADPANPVVLSQSFGVHRDIVTSIAVNEDGTMLGLLFGFAPAHPTGLTVTSQRMLAVALSDGSVQTADIADLAGLRAGAAAVACTRAGGPLDPGQWSVLVPGLDWENTCA